jgi:hypothetical protein
VVSGTLAGMDLAVDRDATEKVRSELRRARSTGR